MSIFDLTSSRHAVTSASTGREWSSIMGQALVSGICIPYQPPQVDITSEFNFLVWAATKNEIIFCSLGGDVKSYKTLWLPCEPTKEVLVVYSDAPYCLLQVPYSEYETRTMFIGPFGMAKEIILNAEEIPVDLCWRSRTQFLLATNQRIRSITISSTRQVEIDVWPDSWLSSITMGLLGRQFGTLTKLKRSLHGNRTFALTPDGYYLELHPDERKVSNKFSIAPAFGNKNVSPCGLAVTDSFIFIAAYSTMDSILVVRIDKDAETESTPYPPIPTGEKVLMSAIKGLCVIAVDGCIYTLDNEDIRSITIDTHIDTIDAMQLHPDGLSIVICGGVDVIERPLKLCMCDESASILLEQPFSRKLLANLASRPQSEVMDAACKIFESEPPLEGFEINCLQNQLYRAQGVIKILIQGGYFHIGAGGLLAETAAACLEKLQGSIMLRKLKDIYPEPFEYAKEEVPDIRDINLFLKLVNFPRSKKDKTVNATVLVNGIFAQYLHAITREREHGITTPYLAPRQPRGEPTLTKSKTHESGPEALMWYVTLHKPLEILCDQNNQDSTHQGILSSFTTLAAASCQAFMNLQHFDAFRDKFIGTVWSLEGEKAIKALELAQEYDAAYLVTKMTYKRDEPLLHSFITESPKLLVKALEFFLRESEDMDEGGDYCIPQFVRLMDKFPVDEDVLNTLLVRYPTYRWAIDLRRGKSITQRCQKMAQENICPNGNQDSPPPSMVHKVDPMVSAALAKICAFAESGDEKKSGLVSGRELHLARMQRKYLGNHKRTLGHRSYLDWLQEFIPKLTELSEVPSGREFVADIRHLISIIEDTEEIRPAGALTEEVLRNFWFAVLKIDREILLSVSCAGPDASETLAMKALEHTIFGLLMKTKESDLDHKMCVDLEAVPFADPSDFGGSYHRGAPFSDPACRFRSRIREPPAKVPRSVEFLLSLEDEDVAVLRPSLQMCMQQKAH